RLLQSQPIGEWSEPFGSQQVGSSAMPFKRNPIHAENLDSLARLVVGLPRVAWDNAAHSLLERTLDDSANRRTMLPESFLIADELLRVTQRILKGLQVNQAALAKNLSIYGPFAATERVLMALARAGADRQSAHERLRQHALVAWEAIQSGEPNPLVDRLCADLELLRYLSEKEIRDLMEVSRHVGDAPERARQFATMVREVVA
ncbi:MAG: adenylosuccinate lyase, partial [Anaerolineales bacterium]|nr:adenylosuccinate lyase [Anaerolineales bacterium]